MLFLTHESNELLVVYKSGSRIMTGLEKVLGVFAYRIVELNVRVNIHVVYRIILLFLLVILFCCCCWLYFKFLSEIVFVMVFSLDF